MDTPKALPLQQDSAGIVTMTLEPNQGPMVVLDDGLIRRIELALRAMPGNAAGLVLASGSPRVFVAGADLKQIAGFDHEGLERYLAFGQRVFGMLCGLTCPTVAAINGAVLGGGLELAMHCDGLVAAPAPQRDGQPGKPYPIGLPEAGLQICPGWGGTNLLPARMNAAEAIERTCTGKTMLIDDAVKGGLIDRFAASSEELIGAAKSWLVENRSIHAGRRDGEPLKWIGRPAFRNQAMAAVVAARQALGQADPAASCLRAVGAGLESGWQAALEVERRELNRLRATDAGKNAIAAFFDRSAKK